MECGYYLLADAFETQKIKYVFLDASALFRSDFVYQNYRHILDDMRLGSNKIDFAKAYAGHFSEEKRLGEFLGAFFSIYLYHERWKELGLTDFELDNARNLYAKGFAIGFDIVPALDTVEHMNELAEYVDAAVILRESADYLVKMKSLCTENGAELVLIKVPSIGLPQYNQGVWTGFRAQAVKALAEKYGLEFLDLLYDYDLGIDWSHDTCDGGVHLNYFGAEKVTGFLSDYLVNGCGLSGTEAPEYGADLGIYADLCDLAEIYQARSLPEYLETLSDTEDITVFMASSQDMISNLSEDEREALRMFGLEADFGAMVFGDPFAAVIEDGRVLIEEASHDALACSGTLPNGASYSLAGGGYLVATTASIEINGENYFNNGRGIAMVVLDNVSGLVLDSVSFDTYAGGPHLPERAATVNKIREYEQWLMKRDYVKGLR
ncbi:MAG: hypothetical protein IJ601_13070 [Acidaminococcaceae bacterium]|nr:hypothetical protein [Acidaminococcaceae bacterium]